MSTFYYLDSAHSNLLCSLISRSPIGQRQLRLLALLTAIERLTFIEVSMKSKRHKILFLLRLIVSFTDWIQSRFCSAFDLRVKLKISRNHNYDIEMSDFVTGYVLKLPLASLGSNIKARRTEAETFPVLRFANHVLEYFDVFFSNLNNLNDLIVWLNNQLQIHHSYNALKSSYLHSTNLWRECSLDSLDDVQAGVVFLCHLKEFKLSDFQMLSSGNRSFNSICKKNARCFTFDFAAGRLRKCSRKWIRNYCG